MTPEEQKALAIKCGYVDAPTARLAYQGFDLAAYTAAVEAKRDEEVYDYQEVLDDHKRLVRELDIAINGIDGAAKQASLCDIVAQVKSGACNRLSEVAELTRKLAAQQALFVDMGKHPDNASLYVTYMVNRNYYNNNETTELDTLLARERERCAEIADNQPIGNSIAARIRIL